MEVRMKKLGLGFLIGLVVVLLGFSVQAQPKAGYWDSRHSDFAAGNWKEELPGCQEGQVGNVISAESDAYAFDQAGLREVKLVKNTEKFDQYRTVYANGILKLFNESDFPWYNDDDTAPEFVADVKEAIVTTWKFKDELGKYNGKIAFFITFEGKFQNPDYSCYSVRIMADYKGESGFQAQNGCSIGGLLAGAKIAVLGPMRVPVDVKPGSCPNPLNFKSKGVLPVAILGTDWLPVRMIDPRSITLFGISPLRWSREDVGTPVDSFFCHDNPCDTDCGEPGDCDKPCGGYECNELGPDGHLDLALKFDTQQIVAKLKEMYPQAKNRALVPLVLEGKLYKGLCITGQDSVIILNKP
jgi:hypothetical protein